VGAGEYLGVTGQGVTGLLAAPGFQPDWPGQMQAQLVGLAALVLLGFFAAWLSTAPLALLIRLLRTPTRGSAAAMTESLPAEALALDDGRWTMDHGPEDVVSEPTATPYPPAAGEDLSQAAIQDSPGQNA
jgi:hypothetical protein